MWKLALLLIIVNVGEAHASCHRYSIWKYPYPQNCRANADAPPKPMARAVVHRPVVITPRDNDIPLPSLGRGEWSLMTTSANMDLIQGMLRLRALRLLTLGE